MTNGASQGLFIVIAVVIFGIFVAISYLLYRDNLTPSLSKMFCDSFTQVSKQTGLNTGECSVPTGTEEFGYYMFPSMEASLKGDVLYSNTIDGSSLGIPNNSENFFFNYSSFELWDETGEERLPAIFGHNLEIYKYVSTYSILEDGYVYTNELSAGSGFEKVGIGLGLRDKDSLEYVEYDIEDSLEVMINDIPLKSLNIFAEAGYFEVDVDEILSMVKYNEKLKNNEIPRVHTQYFQSNDSAVLYNQDIFTIKYKGERIDTPISIEIRKKEGTPG